MTAGLTNDGGNELAAGAPSVYAGREVITYRVDGHDFGAAVRIDDDDLGEERVREAVR